MEIALNSLRPNNLENRVNIPECMYAHDRCPPAVVVNMVYYAYVELGSIARNHHATI